MLVEGSDSSSCAYFDACSSGSKLGDLEGVIRGLSSSSGEDVEAERERLAMVLDAVCNCYTCRRYGRELCSSSLSCL